MARVIGPFMSLDAHGSVGKAITVQRHGKRRIAYKWSKAGQVNKSPATVEQTARRKIYGEAVGAWRALSTADKADWNASAVKERITGWNAFLRQYKPKIDPYWQHVVSLMPLDGTAGGGLLDDVTGRVWTHGGTPTIEAGAGPFGTGALAMPDYGQYLTTPPDVAMDIGTSDYCIELWLQAITPISAGDYSRAMVNRDDTGSTRGWLLLKDGAQHDSVTYGEWRNGVTSFVSKDIPFSAGLWQFIRVCHDNGVLYLFQGGALSATKPSVTGTCFDSGKSLNLGWLPSTGITQGNWLGRMCAFRFTVGASRLATATTIPTGPWPRQ